MSISASIPAAAQSARLPLIDELRGIAFVMMVVFHFCYNLEFFGIAHMSLYQHWFWIGFRVIIVFLFLGLVGVCLSLNHKRGFSWARYGKRLGLLIAAACVISAATLIFVHDFWIFFGIIHMIAVSLIVALPFLFLGEKYRYAVGILGIALFAVGSLYPLNLPLWLAWLWQTPQALKTVDYVPLVPWFGFTLFGLMLGWQARQWARFSLRRLLGHSAASRMTVAMLSWCGKHALILYLVHQPVLWTGFFLWLILR